LSQISFYSKTEEKTDENNAFAIVQTSLIPGVIFIAGKNREQQQLHSMMRLRELAIKQKTALSNQRGALLLEFNIKSPARNGGLRGTIESTLEDAENSLCYVRKIDTFRFVFYIAE